MKPQEKLCRRGSWPPPRAEGSFEPPRILCIPDDRVSAFRTQWSETNCCHYDAMDTIGEHENHDTVQRIYASVRAV